MSSAANSHPHPHPHPFRVNCRYARGVRRFACRAPFSMDRIHPYFGTLQICADDCPPNTDIPFNIVISCDQSGSMSSYAPDGKSAWDHCKYTVGRIISYLKRLARNAPEFRASIHITAFNHDITPISVPPEITADTDVATQENALNDIDAEGLTNFEKPLTALNRLQKPHAKNIQIFLTDGHANGGVTDPDALISKIHEEHLWEHQFIGFSPDHDFRLMKKLSQLVTHGSYQFIDSIEQSGMVYGEILSTFLYRVAENILIRFPTNTFKVYNADTGKWVTSLKIPYIASQDLRTWHIRAAAGEPPSGAVSIGYVDQERPGGATPNVGAASPHLTTPISNYEEVPNSDPEILKQGLRQRVQEALQDVTAEKQGAHEEAEFLFESLKCQCDEHGYSDEPFQKQLMDDLFIAKDTQIHPMYANIRQFTQNAQTAQNITNVFPGGGGSIPLVQMASGPFVPLLTPPSPSAPPRSASFNMRHVHFDTAGDPQVLGEGCDDDPPITPEPPEMAYQISQTPQSSQSTPMRQRTMEQIQYGADVDISGGGGGGGRRRRRQPRRNP